MKDDIPRSAYEKLERDRLQENATFSNDTRFTHRKFNKGKYVQDNFRTEFYRDYTRIIHSRAFRRLHHKTQVFIKPKNDHLSTRMEHSLHVASIARTIARSLRLNEDLVEAISIGHDLGHPPFGHKGEKRLNEIAQKFNLRFSHELHSLRVVDFIDSPYLCNHPGLNLTFAVRDGIACHYGEGFEEELSPDKGKTYDDLLTMRRGEATPATLEGCVVRWSDKIAYLGRDLEDAISIDLISEDEVPNNVRKQLGTKNREIIHKLISELCRNGINSPVLSFCSETHKALNELYNFNMERIYKSPEATRFYGQIDRSMEYLFEFLHNRLCDANEDAKKLKEGNLICLKVLADFLDEDIRDWISTPKEQIIIDYIAGMTDSFFIDSFTEVFLPKSTV